MIVDRTSSGYIVELLSPVVTVLYNVYIKLMSARVEFDTIGYGSRISLVPYTSSPQISDAPESFGDE